MRTKQGKSKVTFVVVALAAIMALAGVAGAGPGRRVTGVAGLIPKGQLAKGQPTDVVYVAVELGLEPTMVVYASQLGAHSNKAAAASAAVSHLTNVRTEQWNFRARLSQAGIGGVSEAYSLQRTYNGIVYVTTRDKLDALKRLPGVKGVHIMTPKKLNNARSVPFVGGPAVWDSLGSPLQGQNVKVGVIDTGVDYLHTDFGGSGTPEDYAANDTSTPAVGGSDAYFPTAKVVGGIDLAGADFDVVNSPEILPVPDGDPMDFEGHGTHVAGTVTGYGVKADGTTYEGPWDETANFGSMYIGPGVAPLASLYAIKITGDNDIGASYLIEAGVEWAVDPDGDGDPADRLDVVNISWGGAFGVEDVDTVVYRNAVVKAGMILCFSQGNSGDTYFVGGSPGSTPEVITVAASGHDYAASNALRVNTPVEVAGDKAATAAGFGPVAPAPVTADLVAAVPSDGCGALTNDIEVAGKIAVIMRGACAFGVKVQNAQDAGAVAVVVVNYAATDLIYMGADTTTITIPSLLISNDDWLALAGATPPVNATVDYSVFTAVAKEPDVLGSFSSRGPTRQGNHAVLKPDISAPGVGILSAKAQTGSRGMSADGTSMAAPHMTGVMALLRQQHPDWKPWQLKALVMNTADHDIYLDATKTLRIGPARAGAGRVDLRPATAGAVIAFDAKHPERVSLSFETLDVVGEVEEPRAVTLYNSDGTNSVTYDVTVDLVTEMQGVAVTLPTTTQVTVPPTESVDVDVLLTADATAMIRAHEATVAEIADSLIGGAPRSWLAETSGYLVFTPTGGGAEPTLRVPFFAALNPASDMQAAGPLATVGRAGTADLALTGTGQETWLYAAEDFPYSSLSLVTPLELLYASPNEVPAGDFPEGYDPANTDGADLQYVGVGSDLVDQDGDLSNTGIFFGLTTHGLWGTPNELLFSILLKRASSPSWEYRLENYDLGYNPANGVYGTDVFATVLWDLASGEGTLEYFLNGVHAMGLYVPTFMSDAMVLPVWGPDLGVTDGDSVLEFQVETYSGSTNALVDRTPVLRYDVANPGFAVGADQIGGFPQPFQIDLDWNQLEVNYDLDAAEANRSGGMLLIHWLNGMGTRGEKVPVGGLTCVTNLECPSSERPVCDTLAGVCVNCLSNADCYPGEYCDMYGMRRCVADCMPADPVGSHPEPNACLPSYYCNETTRLCTVPLALINTTPEPKGDNCPNGGVKIESGIDDNGDLVLDTAEVDATEYVCNGLPTLVEVVDIPAGTGPCANGGQLIHAGVDDNADGTLQESEYDSTWYACNGLDGLTSLVKITAEAAGSNCPAGGKKVETGVDDDADGVLQDDEVDRLEYVCNGVDGATGKQALVNVSDEAAGSNCPAGGKKVEAGIDGNDDGILQSTEVDHTTYICNGTDGATGADGEPAASPLVETTAIAPGSDCAKGGVLVKTGLDRDGNGFLDQSEVTSTTAICDGEKGSGCSATPTAAGGSSLGLLLLLGLLVLRRRS